VLDGGDFFNDKTPTRTSHRLVNRIAKLHQDYPCPVWGNVGNHDVPYSQASKLDDSALGVLFSSGVFQRCYDNHEVVFSDHARKVRVVGVPYHGPFYDLDRFRIEKQEEDYLVVMAHVLASPSGGSMFESEDIIKYDDLNELAPDVDVWCFGHWHKDQGIVEIAPNKWVVNIGSLTRGSLAQDDTDRIPSVASMSFSNKGIEIEKIPLDISPAVEVFDYAKREREETRQAVVSSFVETLQSTVMASTDKSVEEVVGGMEDLPHKVRDRCLEYLELAKD
jgi:DNA repair exonuclease SbcCD nuclease subunit